MFSYPESVKEIIDLLLSNGFKAYLAGGCVRDSIMGVTPHDYDVATSALPEQMMNVFSDYKVIPTGIKHGTVTVLSGGLPVEVTTFRTDGKYSDNRRPDSVSFTASFEDDAKRRDFTVNAMGYNEYEGLLDYFGGKKDIENKIIRCVGDPDERFCEDALRILRALRFSSVLDFDIESKTSSSAIKNRALIDNISAERIREEFVKLLCGKRARDVLSEYSPIITTFIPEAACMIGFRQHTPYHIYDVWEHTLKAVESIPPEVHLRLAAFFHDFGKPGTFSYDENGVGHFYGHAAKSCIIAENVMKRLKFDKCTENRVLAIIKYHDLQIENTPNAVKKCMNKISGETFFDLINMFRADNAAQAPMCRYRIKHYDALEKTARDIIEEKSCFSLASLDIDGDDLINLGIPRGKKIGAILNNLLELVMNEKLENEKKILIDYVVRNMDRL